MSKIIPIFVPHLGCPCSCVFCNQRKISGQVKPILGADVYNEIKNANINGDFEVAFYGGSFTAICESLQNELLDVALKFTDNIRVSTRPDCITDEILQRLIKKGVKTIELGVQSMNNFVLEKAMRGHTREDVINAVNLISKYNFNLGLQMMIGLPYDTLDTLNQTVLDIINLKPNFLRIYPIVLMKDTTLYEMYEIGEYTPLELDFAVDICAKVLKQFLDANINVIRVGLNPTDELSSDEYIKGAYHPAFGQLVYSKLYLKKMENLLKNYNLSQVTFMVNFKEISTAVGQKRKNIIEIYEKYNIKVKIVGALVPINQIYIKE